MDLVERLRVAPDAIPDAMPPEGPRFGRETPRRMGDPDLLPVDLHDVDDDGVRPDRATAPRLRPEEDVLARHQKDPGPKFDSAPRNAEMRRSRGFAPNSRKPSDSSVMVKKLQRRKLEGSIHLQDDDDEECEYEVEVPPGSVLLFPSEKAVDITDLDAIDFEIKNLIVLDGTWAKARRVYSENPWLNILPHIKLKVDKMSLYSEVRREPKDGYLSTIESIVHCLKALGDNHEGLDNLLDAFESMVGYQRRFKDERLTKRSQV